MRRLLAFMALPLMAANHYVSPAGAGATGCAYGTPCNLKTFLETAGAAACGDTIWMMPGTYGTGGSYRIDSVQDCNTAGQYITLRGWPSGFLTSIIDGGIRSITSRDRLLVRDVRVTNSLAGVRTYVDSATDRTPGLYFSQNSNSTVINSMVDNAGQPGVGLYSVVGGTLYGTVVAINGAYDTTYVEQRGSGLYSQGNMTNWDQGLHIEHNVFVQNYTTCGKTYGEGTGVSYARWIGNVGFASGNEPCFFIAHRNGDLMNAISFERNHSWVQGFGFSLRLGYDNNNASYGCYSRCSVNDNHLVVLGGTGTDGSVYMYRVVRPEFRNNTIVGPAAGTGITLTEVRTVATENGSAQWHKNTYHRGGNASNHMFTTRNPTATYSSLAAWQSGSGRDAGSTHSASLPAANEIVYEPNRYERGRGHIAVYNWQNLNNVGVDLSRLGYTVGEAYEIRDAQNPLVVALTGTYDGSAVTIPISTLTTLHPTVGTFPDWTPFHSNNNFGAFLVTRPYGSVATVSDITTTSATVTYKANGGVCRVFLNGVYHGADSGLGLNRTYQLTGLATGTAYTVVSDCMWAETFNTL